MPWINYYSNSDPGRVGIASQTRYTTHNLPGDFSRLYKRRFSWSRILPRPKTERKKLICHGFLWNKGLQSMRDRWPSRKNYFPSVLRERHLAFGRVSKILFSLTWNNVSVKLTILLFIKYSACSVFLLGPLTYSRWSGPIELTAAPVTVRTWWR